MYEKIFRTGHRYETLEAMCTLVEALNDETYYYDRWVKIIPDEADINDLIEIAEDDELYNLVVKTFLEIFGKVRKNA